MAQRPARGRAQDLRHPRRVQRRERSGGGEEGRGQERERHVDFVVLGVGLNANLDPKDLGVPQNEAATLRSELGGDVDLLALLDSLLSHLDFELGRIEDFGTILDDWRALDCTLGERVRVRRFGEVLEGGGSGSRPRRSAAPQTSDGMVELFEGEVEQLRRQGT